jgi:serine/threonine-protein kinase RsbW
MTAAHWSDTAPLPHVCGRNFGKVGPSTRLGGRNFPTVAPTRADRRSGHVDWTGETVSHHVEGAFLRQTCTHTTAGRHGSTTGSTRAGGMNGLRNGQQDSVTDLHAAPPPSHATEVQRWVLATPAQLSELRAALHRALTGADLDNGGDLDDGPGTVVLVASELAANAIRHGLPPTEVRLLDNGDQVILDVADGNLHDVPEVRGADPTAAGGRGLLIAQLLSYDVGWYTDGDTKHIWASFPRAA